ncbi:MAG: ABC transporter permease [Lewinella sp.]
MSAFSRAFAETFRNLRTNFFQTFLSVLGIIIGVGALVAMLAMIDGLEAYAKEQISEGSSLENLLVRANTGTRIDGIYTNRDTIATIDEALVSRLADSLPYAATMQLTYNNSTIGYTADSTKMGLRYQAYTLPSLAPLPDSFLLHGRFLTEADADKRLALVDETVAGRIVGDVGSIDQAIGQHIYLLGDSLAVAGIIKADDPERLSIGMLLSSLNRLTDAPTPYPTLNIALDDVNEVLAAQEFTDGWMKRQFVDIADPVESFTRTGYLEQLAQGLLVFRMVMGFLIGIAVVVGGVGVMNVLLMSISERTPEIGVRKAVGANRGNIITQFLSESVAISAIGCFFGVFLGMAVALIAAPILNYFVEDLEFRAIFSLNTLFIVSAVALLIGVIFGTYPARKAAGLDPVVAIRR